jgi:hypothetical protein
MTRMNERPPPLPSMPRALGEVEKARTRLLRYGTPAVRRSLGSGAAAAPSPEDGRRASHSPAPRGTVDGVRPARKRRGSPRPEPLLHGVWHGVTPWHQNPW